MIAKNKILSESVRKREEERLRQRQLEQEQAELELQRAMEERVQREAREVEEMVRKMWSLYCIFLEYPRREGVFSLWRPQSCGVDYPSVCIGPLS